MKSLGILSAGLVFAAALGTVASGDDHVDPAVMKAVKARQAQMQLYAFNLGQLGAMAKGEVDYDAGAASAAAGNLAKLTSLNGRAVWLPGSDDATLGEDVTAALPAIWEEGSEIGDKAKALSMAAAEMESAAGDGLDALRGAIGDVGKSCGGCHEDYRRSDD
ncbi:cytochrome c [Rhodobacteraceae bacterium 63075]|nr:cytochrome c [Rhodobacteraceae bacterium 63075]